MKPTPALTLLLLAGLLLAPVAGRGTPNAPGGVEAGPQRGANTGAFVDRDGQSHPWAIQPNHTLHWNGEPYVPVGVAFPSAYLREPGDATWAEDQAALDRLRAANVRDLWVDPGRGLLSCPPEATQRLLDALEQRGFRYGLGIQDRPREDVPVLGPLGEPLAIPAEELRPGGTLQRSVPAPGALRVHYALIEVRSEESHSAVGQGSVAVADGVAEIEIALPENRRTLGRYPGRLWLAVERELPGGGEGELLDLWTGMEEYQERLLAYLNRLQFGPGLRFLLNPLHAGPMVASQRDLVPASPAFHSAFAEWLRVNSGFAFIDIRWATGDRAPVDLATTARLIATWEGRDPPEGIAWYLDPEGEAPYPATALRSRFWLDVRDFRADTLHRTMNVLAVALKQSGFDLPVLYEWEGYHPRYSNTPAAIGYDGLAAEVRSDGPGVGERVGGYALAQVAEADRSSWLIAGRLSAAGEGAGRVREDLQELAAAGFRGFFLDAAELPGGVATAATALSGAAPTVPEEGPAICFYPALLPTVAAPRRLESGAWWLPATKPARQLALGDRFAGYEIDYPFGSGRPEYRRALVIWSLDGPREATFHAPSEARVEALKATGELVEFRIRRQQFTLNVTDEPLVITGLDTDLAFPLEEARAMIDEYEALLERAERMRVDVPGGRLMLQQVRRVLNAEHAAAVNETLRESLGNLRQIFSPYVWLEGHRANDHNFQGVSYQAGLSESAFLRLDRPRPPRDDIYRARYVFHSVREATYDLWVAGRPPGDGASPLVWRINDEPPVRVEQVAIHGEPYSDGFAWYRLGGMTLREGRHVLEISVADPVGEPPVYRAGIDAIVLAREPFEPQGSVKPFGRSGGGR